MEELKNEIIFSTKKKQEEERRWVREYEWRSWRTTYRDLNKLHWRRRHICRRRKSLCWLLNNFFSVVIHNLRHQSVMIQKYITWKWLDNVILVHLCELSYATAMDKAEIRDVTRWRSLDLNFIRFSKLSCATAMGKTRKSEMFYDVKDIIHLDLIFIRF